jgi:hypothetical protein
MAGAAPGTSPGCCVPGRASPGWTVTALPAPPGRRPGTIYRHGKPFVL